MTEFEPYAARRERCEAFRFLGPGDAMYVAEALGAKEYTLTQKRSGSFTLTVLTWDGGVVDVNRGDYLVRNSGTTVVVPSREFQCAWEPEK